MQETVSQTAAATPAPSPVANSGRLMSLDALRGFDMFWIVGAGALVHALDQMGKNRLTSFLSTQLSHAEWEGFHGYDLIFPLFVFIAGVSLTFSMDRELARHGPRGAVMRLGRRCLLLILLGLFYYGGFSNPWPGIRLTGVLQTFGVACLLAGCLYIRWPGKARIVMIAFLGLVLGYWIVMASVPFPDLRLTKEIVADLAAKTGSSDPAAIARAATGRVHGVFEEGYNLANYLDFRYLPGKKQYGDGFWEAQGLLQMVMATSSCLLGILAGLWLRRRDIPDRRKVLVLAGAGLVGVVLGFSLEGWFPVVKKLWSPTFVLVAGGYSAVLLAGFYDLVEIRKRRSWCLPFVWIGMNPITIYLAHNIIAFPTLAARFAGGDVQQLLDRHVMQGAGSLLLAVVEIGLTLLFVRFLYVRKIFIRL